MSYHVRVFCLGVEAPSLADLFEASSECGVALGLDPDWAADVDVLSPSWSEAAVLYARSTAPLLWTIDRADDQQGTLGEEVEDFLEMLEDVGDTPDRRRVVAHLQQTALVFTSRLPLDAGDAALEATDAAAHLLVERCAGLVQADGEGFYLDGELRVPVDDL